MYKRDIISNQFKSFYANEIIHFYIKRIFAEIFSILFLKRTIFDHFLVEP